MIRLDLIGQRFGRLLVVEKGGQYRSPCGSSTARRWLCQCDCGGRAEVISASLRNGSTLSCGCLQKERALRSNTTHGMSGTNIYMIWAAMRSRCLSSADSDYEYYGARGITVCERWSAFDNFFVDMGMPPEGYTLERLNNDLGYSLSNCKWATRAEQTINKRPWGTVRKGRSNANRS